VTKTGLQDALAAEITAHLGYQKGERPLVPASNLRNRTSPKTVLTEVGEVPLEVPRDRAGKSDRSSWASPPGRGAEQVQRALAAIRQHWPGHVWPPVRPCELPA
jgi:hypothetical protein